MNLAAVELPPIGQRVETIGNAILILGDCLEAMERLDLVADAVIFDPPYCSGGSREADRTSAKGQGVARSTMKQWFRGDNMGTAGLAALLRAVAFRSIGLLDPAGSLLAFCDWRMVPNIAPAIESAGLRWQNLVVWDKGYAGMGRGFRPRHELVLHFTAGTARYYDLAAGNIVRCSRVPGAAKAHPTEKPVELMADLVKVVCPPGGLVLDPFMGSGSTGVAALSLGARFVGIERDPRHFETACRRLAELQGIGRRAEQAVARTVP